MAHAWYPASLATDSPAAPYRPLARHDHDFVRKTSVASAPFAVTASPAPVILLCPGRGVSSEYNASIAEELASRGYVVLAVDSPYIGRVSFPDGRDIPPSPR